MSFSRMFKPARQRGAQRIDLSIESTSKREYPCSIDDFEVLEKLGQGGFGSVYKVNLIATKETFALKKVELETYTDAKRAMVEIKTMEACSHQHIINYFKFFVHSDKTTISLCILMEFAPCGDLLGRIKRQKSEGFLFEEKKILNWFSQICLAVDYIHQKHIIHRDLKPQNILLINDDYIKVADFGIAKVLDSTTDLARTMVGTMYFMAPEVFNGEEYTSSADIWSLGIILITISTLGKPFRDVKSYLRGESVEIPEVHENVRTIVDLITLLNPDDRIPLPAIIVEMDNITKAMKQSGCCLIS